MKLVEKKCFGCGQIKPIGEFYNNRRNPTGYNPRCKLCCLASQRSYNQLHRVGQRARSRKWYRLHKESELERNRQSRERNKDAYVAGYKKRNRLNKSYQANWAKNKRATDPAYKVNQNVSRAIRLSIRGGKRGRGWESVIGYSLEMLMGNLEAKFQKGMNWNNYGQWHIDHIRPKSSFSYVNMESQDFLDCWSLDNLQPLWATENLRKSDKYDHR